MRKILLFVLFMITSFLTSSNAQVVISQYVETSSGSIPKGIEIWNPTMTDIDLSVSNITIFKGTNGSSPSLDHTVSTGILKAGNVIVVGTSNMDPSGISDSCPDALFSPKNFTFNGDDAIQVFLDGVIQDVIGTPGSDPGSSWSGSGVSTANQNIQLLSGITTGDTDGWTDPSTRFSNIGAGTSTADFGKPTDGCPNTGGDTEVQFGIATSDFNEDAATVTVCVNILNEDATNDTSVDIELDAASTSINGADYTTITFPSTLTFPAGSNAQQCLSIDITDDTDEEDDETLVLNLANATGGLNAMIGTNTQHTLTINSNDVPLPSIDDIRINEVDADTPGTDVAEFVELFGLPFYSLDGLVLVFYNGGDDKSYKAIDLDGFELDLNGYFILGGPGAPGNPEVSLGGTQDQIQNGADAVALFLGDNTDFPNDTPISTSTLIDVLVYGVNDADDTGLLNGFNEIEQIDENINNDSQNQSIQRGSWFVTAPTPRGENILPVELVSFDVQSKDNQNVLSWTTATEINNDFFSIERSNNGNDFETIGKVNGSGNSYASIYYRHVDKSPNSGANYYRIKQIDFDGKYEYSDILRADNMKSRISIYPTTTSDYINIVMDEQQVASLIVFNEVGQTIKEMTTTEMQSRIDISDLPNGIYFAQVNTQSGKEIKKIIKQ
jgi:hypothetical protein